MFADGEGVWSWHPDADANPRVKSPGGRRQKSPVSEESSKETVTPSCRECRNVRRTCGDYTRVLFSLHTRPPVRKASGIPCALYFDEGRCLAKLGQALPRERAFAPCAL